MRPARARSRPGRASRRPRPPARPRRGTRPRARPVRCRRASRRRRRGSNGPGSSTSPAPAAGSSSRAAPSTWDPARCSSSIAACASYVTSWRRSRSELTASNRRPMLDVGTQPIPTPSWRSRTVSSSGASARTGARSPSQEIPAARRCAERDARRPPDGRVATGQRHVAEVRDALEVVVAGDERLTAPDGAVGPEAGAVEREPDDPLPDRHLVLRHHRGDVRVMVLHEHRRVRRPGSAGRAHVGPLAGVVAGVRVGEQNRRLDLVERLELPRSTARTPRASRGCRCRRCAGSSTRRVPTRGRTCSSARRRPRARGRWAPRA